MMREVLQRWYMPFAWVTLSSLVAVPLAMYLENGMALQPGTQIGLGYGRHWVERTTLLTAMMPYLLNLIAAYWFVSPDGSTRWAAFWATLIAVAHVVAPVALAVMSGVAAPNGQHVVDWQTLRFVLWFQDIEMLLLGVAVWVAFGRFVGNSAGSAASHVAYYAEA
ncbi:MAG: hypothetical protein IVW36_10210 [Dehalococcoidia bacterium]|nr:hypothetical protein [Dehalococcoidia bacterium]